MCGFTIVRRKSDKKLVFAYKFKHSEGMVLYYDFGVEREKVREIKIPLLLACRGIGYELCNIVDRLKILDVERGSVVGGKNG